MGDQFKRTVQAQNERDSAGWDRNQGVSRMTTPACSPIRESARDMARHQAYAVRLGHSTAAAIACANDGDVGIDLF